MPTRCAEIIIFLCEVDEKLRVCTLCGVVVWVEPYMVWILSAFYYRFSASAIIVLHLFTIYHRGTPALHDHL